MKNGNYTLGHHLVAFLDVLGQRESFRGLRLPKNAEEEAQVKEVLRKTAGFVVTLREVFQTQVQVFEAGAAGMRARRKKEWGRVQASEPNQIWQTGHPRSEGGATLPKGEPPAVPAEAAKNAAVYPGGLHLYNGAARRDPRLPSRVTPLQPHPSLTA